MEWPDSLTYRPIEKWPQEYTRNRKLSPFSAPLKSTLTMFRKELGAIKGKNAVLQIALSESQFRIDGAPRAQAIPEHPGVILSIETPDGPLSFPCDTFSHWHDNLRAIVLTMERLRAVGRYGVTKHGEQYTGWKALPATASEHSAFSKGSAFEYLVTTARIADVDRERFSGDVDGLVRRALRYAHPDTGGSESEVQRVRDAERALRA